MDQNIQELKNLLGEKARVQEPLARHTTFKIGGPADLFYNANSVDELSLAIKTARNLAVPVFIMGGGSNILIGDKGIRGLVIKNNANRIVMLGAKGIYKGGTSSGNVFVQADSGVMMNSLVRQTIEESLAGLEMHLGLPGTVGGALFMNSKWTNPASFVGDAVYQATILTLSGDMRNVPRDYFHFGYDESAIQSTGDIVLTVIFSLKKSLKQLLWETANRNISYRRDSQPQGVCSSGCTFRNISKAEAILLATPNHMTSAGFFIDHSGLKGKVQGGAQISPKHANFIINQHHATALDVVQLIELARSKVYETFGVKLVEEIVRVGEF